MRRSVVLAGATLAAVAAALVGPVAPAVDAGGGPTTSVLVVHGLNIDGQDSQSDGGNEVTVCNNDNVLQTDFGFGQIFPLTLPTGADVAVQVYLDDDEDCADPDTSPAIDQTVNIPPGTVALVATDSPASDGVPELLAVPLNVECVEEGSGRLTAVHAADADPVDVLVDGQVRAPGLAYGESAEADLPAGTVSVEVRLSGGPTIVPATDVVIDEAVNRIIYVVGNLDGGQTPVVPLFQDLTVPVCEQPAPEPEEPTPAPRDRVVAARPTFTG